MIRERRDQHAVTNAARIKTKKMGGPSAPAALTPSSDCQTAPAAAWLVGGGELGELIRATDWSATPLGASGRWPQSLRSAVSILLPSKAQICLFWGRDLVAIYNDAYRCTLGMQHPWALGRAVREMGSPFWQDVLRPLLERVLTTGEALRTTDYPFVLQRHGYSEETYFDVACDPVRDESGAVGGVFCIFSETTGRVVGERRMRLLLDLSRATSGARSVQEVFDKAAGVLASNAHDLPFALLLDAHGTPRAGCRVELRQDWPIEQCYSAARTGADMARGGAEIMVEAELLARLGLLSGGAWAEPVHTALLLPVTTPGQAPYGFLLAGISPRRALDDAYRDFLRLVASNMAAAVATARALEAQRKQAEALDRMAKREVELQRAQLFALFMKAPNPILILHRANHVIELANPPACEVLQRRPEDLLNRPLYEAVPELRAQGLRTLLDGVMRTGESDEGKETPVHLRREDGGIGTHYFNFVYTPLRGIDDRIEGILVTAFNVTDEVLAREQMSVLRRDAEAASRAKDEFLAMLSHELRNPLAPMATAVQLMRLRDAAIPELGTLERQIAHLTRLVDDLLDVSRITRGKIALRKCTIEIADAVLRALEMASPLLEPRAHRVDIAAVPRQGLAVDADPERLAQVIFNLLSNAAKYSEPGSTITLRAWRAAGGADDANDASDEEDRIYVSVTDEGLGIAPDMIDQVFEMFVQQEQTLARSEGGLGLGLTIVRSLLDRHDGKVSVRSAGIGQGSEFLVDLPAAPAAARPEAGTEMEQMPVSLVAARRILVVDDNVDAATVLADLLAMQGHQVKTAYDGLQALSEARHFHPDIALIDIGLPVMDGYELAQRLREQAGKPSGVDSPQSNPLRLIAVTGYGLDRDRERSAQVGFTDHLVKPIDFSMLERILLEPDVRPPAR